MAEFYVSLSTMEIAAQIALLINKYNLWVTKYTANTIYTSSASYFVELINSRVIGCASILKVYPTLSRIQHICVIPEFRHKEVATKLTKLAIEMCDTEYIYMTIREDNIPSLNLANTLDFKYIRKHWFRDHYTLTVGRRKSCDQKSVN
jgi:ribosomal protein S18 acetylase RimI-like enzyme